MYRNVLIQENKQNDNLSCITDHLTAELSQNQLCQKTFHRKHLVTCDPLSGHLAKPSKSTMQHGKTKDQILIPATPVQILNNSLLLREVFSFNNRFIHIS